MAGLVEVTLRHLPSSPPPPPPIPLCRQTSGSPSHAIVHSGHKVALLTLDTAGATVTWTHTSEGTIVDTLAGVLPGATQTAQGTCAPAVVLGNG